jgi:hypothetical protein
VGIGSIDESTSAGPGRAGLALKWNGRLCCCARLLNFVWPSIGISSWKVNCKNLRLAEQG